MPEGALNPGPRIEPVPLSDAESRVLLETLGDRAGSNFLRTLVHNPRIFKRWLPYSDFLTHGCLPDRERALLLLRAIHRSGSLHAWEEILPLARSGGLSEGEIGRIQERDLSGWSGADASLLGAVDELVDEHELSDRTWGDLAGRYDERQMIEIPMVVGVFFAHGCTLNSLGIQPDAGVGR